MYNRRRFLKASAAASSACVVGGAMGLWPARSDAAWERSAGSRIEFYKVMFDSEQAAGIDFGRAALAAGLSAEAIGQDVTSVWYDDLYHRWREAPAAIAGLTAHHVAFCMQMLGQDAGLRVVYRAEHRPTGDGRLEHRLTGPATLLAHASTLDAGAEWSRGAMELIRRCPAQRAGRSALTFTSTSRSGPGVEGTLVSWVIAPVARV